MSPHSKVTDKVMLPQFVYYTGIIKKHVKLRCTAFVLFFKMHNLLSDRFHHLKSGVLELPALKY